MKFSPRSGPEFLVLLGIAIVLWSCGDDGGPTDPGGNGEPTLATVALTPAADTLWAVGETQSLQAVGRDAQGQTISGLTFTWSSSDEDVATVSEDGVVTAVANGAAEITATAQSVSGSAAVAVFQLVTAVTVSPDAAALETVGTTQQFSASAVDANDNAVDGVVFVWHSTDPAVAIVDPDGLATSRGAGATVIMATAQDIPGLADLTVTQVVDHLAFRQHPTDAATGGAIDPAVQVEARDGAGNHVRGFTGAITLSIGGDPSGVTLAGSRTVLATDGVATFSGLSIDLAGPEYTLVASAEGATAATSDPFAVVAPVVIYRESPAWGNGEEIVLRGEPFRFKLERDYSIRPMADLQAGIPDLVRVVILASDAAGDVDAVTAQNDPAAQAALVEFLERGGWLLGHLGDNVDGGYMIPGLTGVADETDSCSGLTLVGPNDHPLRLGPNEMFGGSDDLNSTNIDTPGSCSETHGSLEGILPDGALVLITEQTGDLRPVYATYPYESGTVVVSTITLEFLATLTPPVPTLRNHFYWALRGAGARVQSLDLATAPVLVTPEATASSSSGQ